MKNALNKSITDEKGQALTLALILLVIGALILTPLLNFVGSGLLAGQVFEGKAFELYAADAGIENALWQIRNDQLATLLHNYCMFDFTTEWTYALPQQINDEDAAITLRNIWIPKNIPVPSRTTARNIIEAGKLIVTGSVSESTFRIRISFTPAVGEEDALRIQTLGVWLPPGFGYVAGSSNLEAAPYAVVPVVSQHAGGQAVVWTLGGYPFAGDSGARPPVPPFPRVTPGSSPLTSDITFQFTGRPGRTPEAVAWITTSGVADIPFSWDADIRVHNVTSTAGNTTIEAYAIKSEARQLGATIAGNYFAAGNSLLGGNLSWRGAIYRYQLHNSTQASIPTSNDPRSGIPAGATVEAAYLYWTGWISWHGHNPIVREVIFRDDASNFNAPPMNWTAGGRWSIYNGNQFRGRGGDSAAARRLTFTDSLDLSPYSGRTLIVSWQHREVGTLEGDDILYFAFSGDGGSTWSSDIVAFRDDIGSSFRSFSYIIPNRYLTANFRLRFFWQANMTDERVYIDNITITEVAGSLKYPSGATPENLRRLVEETARVNRVLFNNTRVIADTYQVLYPPQFDGTVFASTWFYTAMADVTRLVRGWIAEDRLEPNGAGWYTLGHYFVGTDPNAPNYRGNAVDPTYSFDFHGGGGRTGYPLSTPSPNPTQYTRYQAAHAGWSLLIIYSSPDIKGHQLYLYDIQNPNFDFIFGWHNNVDFDHDGNPGGTISGFLVPDPIPNETLAGRITLFVGEGDAGFTEDFFRVNRYNMSNIASPENNVWNSDSPGLAVPGVDIDTFDITWDSGILAPGDTSVQIDIPTGTDGFTITYIIFSFRSDITTGGTVVFLIR